MLAVPGKNIAREVTLKKKQTKKPLATISFLINYLINANMKKKFPFQILSPLNHNSSVRETQPLACCTRNLFRYKLNSWHDTRSQEYSSPILKVQDDGEICLFFHQMLSHIPSSYLVIDHKEHSIIFQRLSSEGQF